MTSLSGYSRPVMTVLALSACCLFLQGQAVQPGLFTIGDPSPDLPFGTPATGQSGSAGRVVSLAMSPDGLTLYAAAEISGVWKSTDGAHTWTQASNGLRNGRAASHASLAVDGQSPNRLLFASGADDGRPGHPYGGLWVSDDAAMSWNHVTLCAGDTVIKHVIFASGRPYVATTCGLWTTADAHMATGSWTELSNWPQDTQIREMADGGNGTVFTCAGNTVYQIANVNAPTSTSWPALPGKCVSLAAAPTGGATAGESVVVSYEIAPQNTTQVCGSGSPTKNDCLEFAVLDFGTGQTQLLGSDLTEQCCGQPQVRTQHIASAGSSALLPGFAYDVYAADGCDWFELQVPANWPGPTTWKTVMPRGPECLGSSGIHADTWDMAFGPDYDPPHGKCAAYASTDGGVYAAQGPANGDCVSSWVLAQSGLHALNSNTMAGVPLPLYPSTGVLFLPTGDNDVWARLNAVILDKAAAWFPARDGLGDAGQALVDPLAPEYAQLSRNLYYRLATGPVQAVSPAPMIDIVPTPTNAPCTSANGKCYEEGVFGAPGQGGIAAVLTLPRASNSPGPAETPPVNAADFVAVAAISVPPSPEPTPSRGPDMVLRCSGTDCTGPVLHWKEVSSSFPFSHGVAKVLAAGGHSATVIYVLTPRIKDPQTGQIWRSTPATYGQQVSWTLANGTGATSLKNPINFYVNPYASNELYALDEGDETIKVSFDSGRSWNAQPTLTQFATNSQIGTGNAYVFGCDAIDDGPPYAPYSDGCALSGMAFDPYSPNLRVATSEFGGLAFSRDGGQDWMTLNVTNNVVATNSPLTQQVNSAYYDYPDETIYAALHGGSLLSVKGPFLVLEQMTIEYPPTTAARVFVTVSPMGASFWLTKNSDESFSGTLLFDSSKYNQLTFAFSAPPFATQQMTHVLTAGELSSGVATLTCLVCVPERQR